MRDYISIDPEVSEALSENRPVVALESTIVTHGMPYPDNVRTAQAVAAEIRAEGAVPATIAVIDGMLRVGLTARTIADLAQAGNVAKLSRADLAEAIATGRSGSTTVAATMIAAHAAGIRVFATGGIGGVHRGADRDFDISADLQELAQTPVTVVCAGPKAVLDIKATLEVLETLGVPVFAFGQDDLPAFWSRSSGLRAPLRADSPDTIARAARVRAALGVPGGQLVTHPIPEGDEIPSSEIGPMIEAAIAEAGAAGIRGKDVTPFLLDSILKRTEGRSLAANAALIRNNARLAARIARAFRGL